MRYYQNSLHVRLNKYALFGKMILLTVICFTCCGLLLSTLANTEENPVHQLAIVAAAGLLAVFGLGCVWMLVDIVRSSRRLKHLQQELGSKAPDQSQYKAPYFRPRGSS
ncbi:MAG: hypothetical protein KF690_05805 [Bacteroidetes bacterium]|nr:hypothetical protein [Bacteroidota bacterium]